MYVKEWGHLPESPKRKIILDNQFFLHSLATHDYIYINDIHIFHYKPVN